MVLQFIVYYNKNKNISCYTLTGHAKTYPEKYRVKIKVHNLQKKKKRKRKRKRKRIMGQQVMDVEYYFD
jgi:hypothetical protein